MRNIFNPEILAYKKGITLLICSCILVFKSNSQSKEDSLLHVLSIQQKNSDTKNLGKTHYALLEYYYKEYRDSLALYHLQQSIYYSDSISDKETLAKGYNYYGNIHSDKGENKEALDYYKKAMNIAEELGDRKRVAIVKNNVGLIYKGLGNYEEALENLYEALRAKEDEKMNSKSISSTLLNIGLVLDILERYDEAITYYNRSLEIKKSLDDSLGICRIYSNLAVISKNLNRFERAKEEIKNSNQYNTTVKNKSLHYVNSTNMSNIEKHLGNFDLALAYINEALATAQELENSTYLCDTYQNLGSLFYDRGNFRKGLEFQKKALSYISSTKSYVQYQEVHSNLSVGYAALNNYTLAYDHLEKSNLYRDSIYSIEGQRAIEDMREKYEAEKLEKTIALQDVELLNQKLEIEEKENKLFYTIGGGVLFVLLITLVFINYRNQQQRKQQAIQFELENYSKEIEMLRATINAQMSDTQSTYKLDLPQLTLNNYLIDPLTERELEVLRYVASGKPNREIAESIYVSENTIKYHLKNIYLKLDVQNRTEALAKAGAMKILKSA